jgi:hypothetical protein
MEMRVLICDRRELADAAALLDELGVESVDSAADAPEVALVSASYAARLPDLAGCVRVLFHDGNVARPVLTHCEYQVRRPVHPEALRLLLLHLLYRGEERRREMRTPVGLEIRLDIQGRSVKATLVDLSGQGARLHLAQPLEAGARLTLVIEGISAAGTLSIPARVKRIDGEPRIVDRGLHSAAIRFDDLSDSLRRELDWILVELGETPPPLEAVLPSDESGGRRQIPRRSFVRKVPAFEAKGLRVLMGRDLSAEGMRIEPAEGLAAGDRLELALYGAEREEPMMLDATVVRDDGASGLALRFDDLDDARRQRVQEALTRLPAIEASEGGHSHATHPSRVIARR